MAGTSSYFGKSKNTVEVSAKSVVRRYKTRIQPIKIEYETNNVAPALKIEENNIHCNNIKEEKKEESETNNVAPALKIEENNIHCSNIKDEKKEKSQTNHTPCVDIENSEAHININIKEEIIKNELIVKSEEYDNDSWTPDWVPKNWEIVLHNIKEMRKYRTAVVDTLGCERLSEQRESPEVRHFQTLTSLLLSSQTKDEVTSAAVERLKKHGLNIPNIIKTPENKLGKLIHPVGFWKKKAQYLKKCALICQENYHGDIPSTLKGLMSLPGIGPKMSHICMSVAWGEVSGIGVDRHVHRIANRLGWVRNPTEVPDQTRVALQSWLPKYEWKDISILFVGFGQEMCKSVAPNCQSCLNKDICPAAGEIGENRKKKKIEKQKVKKRKMKVEVEE